MFSFIFFPKERFYYELRSLKFDLILIFHWSLTALYTMKINFDILYLQIIIHMWHRKKLCKNWSSSTLRYSLELSKGSSYLSRGLCLSVITELKYLSLLIGLWMGIVRTALTPPCFLPKCRAVEYPKGRWSNRMELEPSTSYHHIKDWVPDSLWSSSVSETIFFCCTVRNHQAT